MSEHKWRPGQRERLADLLGRFGNSILTTEQFWSQMRQAGLDDSHIDRFCSEEAHWTPDAGSSDDDLPGIRDTGLDEPIDHAFLLIGSDAPPPGRDIRIVVPVAIMRRAA